ncbi:MAG: hypothetical protein QGI34_03015 [Candidatus Latescibacteria bacterium]|jgi:hypothetical protein|nr:hypothetical protein [Candidatus Latescibacterota bacterium]
MVESLAGACNSNRHRSFKGINIPCIFGALDQLHGSGTWKKPPGWGGFIITFPEGSGGAARSESSFA